ncbi:siderophore-iron reductase FhuF [Marinobacter nanhaiticus D15-8W]|uniref:Siderophore-iron reductase FhuF n=1 Tax=Marinobacter nanhaiticus D15-8W TaxID=626887 RepID=N6W2J9_9GAMM|nr:siderophore-iron reductase FhuF [Marinobacter nanhaiticus]ENO16755.1 siderophore-iron reductase FhuF [Marinobacter nanhaiticus D15-8W]BES72563.1 siderophore-iron reductase FhuF [Marinobacter nanhaiticus D15-8W]
MISALAPLFVGDFAHYRDVLVLENDPRPSFPARDLTEPDVVVWLLEQYEHDVSNVDRRALVSQWSRTYFLKLTVPTVAANLVLNRQLPVGLDTMEIVLDDEGLPAAFKIPDEGQVWSKPPAGPFERFGALLDGNFSPFIESMHRQVKVSRKVLWSNAANYFEWLISAMAHLSVPEPMLKDGRALIDTERRTDGSRNPMYAPVRYVERATGPSPLRQRRHCCIRYLLPDLDLCENCPHIDNPPKGAGVAGAQR